ncbi:hypothetical protein KVH_14790 (plasmid) [Ketogulonicigenium vulgare]|nr:hypothetical protein KVH_14790 [Ketogulonicigenium vulgare]
MGLAGRADVTVQTALPSNDLARYRFPFTASAKFDPAQTKPAQPAVIDKAGDHQMWSLRDADHPSVPIQARRLKSGQSGTAHGGHCLEQLATLPVFFLHQGDRK